MLRLQSKYPLFHPADILLTKRKRTSSGNKLRSEDPASIMAHRNCLERIGRTPGLCMQFTSQDAHMSAKSLRQQMQAYWEKSPKSRFGAT